MRPAALERIPAPLRRVAAFTVAGAVVYVVLLAAGALLFPASASPGSGYALSATVAAGVAALYLVYLGGIARLRDLLG